MPISLTKERATRRNWRCRAAAIKAGLFGAISYCPVFRGAKPTRSRLGCPAPTKSAAAWGTGETGEAAGDLVPKKGKNAKIWSETGGVAETAGSAPWGWGTERERALPLAGPPARRTNDLRALTNDRCMADTRNFPPSA